MFSKSMSPLFLNSIYNNSIRKVSIHSVDLNMHSLYYIQYYITTKMSVNMFTDIFTYLKSKFVLEVTDVF